MNTKIVRAYTRYTVTYSIIINLRAELLSMQLHPALPIDSRFLDIRIRRNRHFFFNLVYISVPRSSYSSLFFYFSFYDITYNITVTYKVARCASSDFYSRHQQSILFHSFQNFFVGNFFRPADCFNSSPAPHFKGFYSFCIVINYYPSFTIIKSNYIQNYIAY